MEVRLGEQSTIDTTTASDPFEENPDAGSSTPHRKRTSWTKRVSRYWALLTLFTYLVGLGSGYLLGGKAKTESNQDVVSEQGQTHIDMNAMLKRINPAAGYKLPSRYGDFAPKLVAAGVIDFEKFRRLYQEIGNPLNG